MTTIICECCWVTPVELSLRNDEHFCSPCRGHKFSAPSMRADHKALMTNLLANHAGAIAGLTREIEQIDARLTAMRAERDELAKAGGERLADASELTLKAIEGQAIMALQADVQRAYKARNRAMNAVWTIDERHHATAGEKCSCGKPLYACVEYNGLDFIRSEYERWEIKQIGLMKDGKEHGLPENHPEARKLNRPSYEWHGMRSTEPERNGRGKR